MDKHLELLRASSEGDRQAFQELYHIFKVKVYNTALSYMKNEQDAEEVLQDVFVKIHQSAAKFEGKSAVSTWIYRITINTSLNLIKKKERYSFLKFGPFKNEEPDFVHPGVLLENRENGKILFKAIDLLPDKQKTAFILSFIEELPRQEVADVMELSLKATESLLQRAKQNLRKQLDSFYPNRRKIKK